MSALSTEAGLLNLLEGIRLSGPSTLLLTSNDVIGEGGDDYDDTSGVVESDYDERVVKMSSGDGRGETVGGSDDVRGMVEGSQNEGGVKGSAGYDCISSEIDDNGGQSNGGRKTHDTHHSNGQQHCHTHNSSNNNNNNNSNINIDSKNDNSSSSSSSSNSSSSSSSGNISSNNIKCRVEEVNITVTQGTEKKSHSDISVVSCSEDIEIGSRNSSISKNTAHEVVKGVGRIEGEEIEIQEKKEEKEDKGEDEVSRYEERKAKKELYKQKQQKGQNSHKNGDKLGGKSSGLDAIADDFRVGGILGRGKGIKAGFQISQVRGLYDDDEEEEGQGEGGEGGAMVGKVRRKGVIYFVPRSNGVPVTAAAAAAALSAAVTESPMSQGEAGERTGAEGGRSGVGLHTNVYSQSALSLPLQGGDGCGGGSGSGSVNAGEDGDVIGGEVPGLGFLSYIADSEDGVMRACALRTIVVSYYIVCSALFSSLLFSSLHYTTLHYTTLHYTTGSLPVRMEST